ncbi:MAG: hypothetical protein IIA67_02530 [Planctomycetes bacterium]|nr:hypothetical protein [Planctomycetota bacterium]
MAPESPSPDNPYQSPPPETTIEAELAEGLTRRQRTTLQFYLKYREPPPTVMGLAAMSVGRWLALMVLTSIVFSCALGVVMLIDASLTVVLFLIGLMIGMCLGAAARDAGIFRNFVHVWPVLRDVLNWQRIEERLGEDG